MYVKTLPGRLWPCLLVLFFAVAAFPSQTFAEESSIAFEEHGLTASAPSERWRINKSEENSRWAYANFADTRKTTSLYLFVALPKPDEGLDAWTKRQLGKVLKRFGGNYACSAEPTGSRSISIDGVDSELVLATAVCGSLTADTAYTGFQSPDGERWVFSWFYPTERHPAIEADAVASIIAGVSWR